MVEKGVANYWAEMNKASVNSTKIKAVASLPEEKPSKKQKVSLKLGTKVAAVSLPLPKASPVLAVPGKVVSTLVLPTANKQRALGDPAKISPPTTSAAVPALSKETALPAPGTGSKITSVTPQRTQTPLEIAARLAEEAEALAVDAAIDIGSNPVIEYELEDEEFEALD